MVKDDLRFGSLAPIQLRLSKHGALRGWGFCVDNQISDGLERQGLSGLCSKKAPVLIHKAYYFRTATRHEYPVKGSLNSYSYGWFGSKTDSQ